MTSRAWDEVRAFALAMPRAIEDQPWGEWVIKIDHPPRRRGNGLAYGPMFLWLGRPDAPTPAVSVKLGASYDQAAETNTTKEIRHGHRGASAVDQHHCDGRIP